MIKVYTAQEFSERKKSSEEKWESYTLRTYNTEKQAQDLVLQFNEKPTRFRNIRLEKSLESKFTGLAEKLYLYSLTYEMLVKRDYYEFFDWYDLIEIVLGTELLIKVINLDTAELYLP